MCSIEEKMKNNSHAQDSCFRQGPSFVIWFTGLPGSGKSTIADYLTQKFRNNSLPSCNIDGDELRKGLCSDLDFSFEGRKENIRRAAFLSKMMMDAGMIVITSTISPFESERNQAKNIIGAEKFILAYIDCPLEICKARDPKGLYKKARQGKVKNFTGINDTYECPENPDIIIKSNEYSVELCVEQIITSIGLTCNSELSMHIKVNNEST